VLVLADFFLGDSLGFFGDFGDLGDLAFFGDSLFFFGDLVDLALAALAFLGDVASFFGLDGAFLTGDDVDVEAFFVTVFLMIFFPDLAFDPIFLGDLVADFFELDVDLFFGDDGAVVVVEVPDVACVVVVATFLDEDFFFFLSLFLDPGASLYDAFTFTNKVPSLRFRESLTCLRAVSKSIL